MLTTAICVKQRLVGCCHRICWLRKVVSATALCQSMQLHRPSCQTHTCGNSWTWQALPAMQKSRAHRQACHQENLNQSLQQQVLVQTEKLGLESGAAESLTSLSKAFSPLDHIHISVLNKELEVNIAWDTKAQAHLTFVNMHQQNS